MQNQDKTALPLLETVWEGYNRVVVPATAGDTQRSETRVAFYAGATAMFSLITGAIDTMSEEGAMKTMDSLQKEIDAFAAEMLARAAMSAATKPTQKDL